MRRISGVVVLSGVFVVFIISVFLFARSYDVRPVQLTFQKTSSNDDVTLQEKTDIFFLKTHKCASSTVQNILMRYGYRRHLDFVLPQQANYLGHPARFHKDMISKPLTSVNQTYNIFTHHTRYNYEEMKTVMNSDAKFVTIFRDSASLFESMYQFYHMETITNVTLQKFIKTPKLWKTLETRLQKKLGANQMSFDLGLDVDKIASEKKDVVDNFIRQIENEFDLVMITEYMEASLVLLSHLMNWPLERVAFLKLNSRQPTRKIQLSHEDRQILRQINFIDTKLYSHFLNKFRRLIDEFGRQKMKIEVKKLLDINSKLRADCVDKPNVKGYAQTFNYDLRNQQDFTCFYAVKDELSFTDEIRNDQIKRFEVIKNLDDLMTSP